MPVHFKGITTEYRRKFRRPKVRSRSASPHRRMIQAGVRSDHLGISREPQFLSRRKIPTHPPQVSQSLQWELHSSERSSLDAVPGPARATDVTTTTSTREAVGMQAVPRAGAGAGGDDLPQTPLAPRSPRPSEVVPILEEKLQLQPPQPESRLPSPDRRLEAPIDGVHRVLMRKAGLRPGRQESCRRSEYQRQFDWKDRVASSPMMAADQAVHASTVLPMHSSNPVPQESEYRRNYKGSPPPRPPRLRTSVEANQQIPLLQRESAPSSPPPPKTSSKAKRKKSKDQRSDRKCSSSKEEVAPCQPISTKQEASPPKAQPALVPYPGYRKVKSEYHASFRSPLQYQYRDGAWVKLATVADERPDSAYAWYHEVRELREKASLYRRRAWGTHFSRQHFNQILSEQNHLWEGSEPSSGHASSSSSSTEGSAPSAQGSRNGVRSPIIEALDLARVCSGADSAASARASPSHSSTRGRAASDAPAAVGITTPTTKQAWAPRGEGHPHPHHRRRKEAEPAHGEPASEPTITTVMEERAEDDRRAGQGRDDLELVEEVGEEEERENEERGGDGGGMGEGGGEGEQGSEAGSGRRDRGRMATPIMKALSLAQRKHHDRTTPTTGALLVSPTRLKAPAPLSPSPLRKPRSPHRAPAPLPSKVDEARLAHSPPTAGMRTLDPLPLRDDVWVDVGITAEEPQRKKSPARRSSRRRAPSAQDWDSPCATANRIHGSLRNPEFQHNGNLGLLRPWLFVYPTSETAVSDEGEEERMSQISARSAESCSMATHVLGRAMKRKDDFWGKS